MAHLNRKQIQSRAYDLLEANPGGMRWGQLLKQIHSNDPDTPANSIQGALHALLSSAVDITKVARGSYQLQAFAELSGSDSPLVDHQEKVAAATKGGPFSEADFYESFAQWLVDGAEEANEAAVVGGSLLRAKWGTPDVIGVLKARADDVLKFPTQVVSAEIKIDPHQPVTAFGQSIAYRLFSHKSYIVVPNTTSEDDKARLKALCGLHGVGLVTFDLDLAAPDYTIIVPAAYAEPDMFYANQMAKRLREVSAKVFNRFFS